MIVLFMVVTQEMKQAMYEEMEKMIIKWNMSVLSLPERYRYADDNIPENYLIGISKTLMITRFETSCLFLSARVYFRTVLLGKRKYIRNPVYSSIVRIQKSYFPATDKDNAQFSALKSD